MMNEKSDSLKAALTALLDTAKKGEWDRISEIPLEALAPGKPDGAETPAALRNNLKLLQEAMALCQDRVEQIAPLVSALSSKSPDQP